MQTSKWRWFPILLILGASLYAGGFVLGWQQFSHTVIKTTTIKPQENLTKLGRVDLQKRYGKPDTEESTQLTAQKIAQVSGTCDVWLSSDSTWIKTICW